MNEKIKILGIAGSLRKSSYNKALLRACIELKPENMEIEIFDIKNIPFYNQDVQDIGFPEPVQVLKDKITECDGLLIATPEYNYSIPGVLKNAIDWVSRSPDKTPLIKKPVAFLGASSGMSGTIRAQLHFRHVAQYNNMMDMKKPEILVTKAAEKFSPDGKLTDENTRLHLKKFLKAFEEWIYIFKLKEVAEGQNK